MTRIVASNARPGAWRAEREAGDAPGSGGEFVVTALPRALGGDGAGFSSTDLLAAALATCTASSVERVVEREGIPLAELRVSVDKELATGPTRLARLAIRIEVGAPLDEAQRAKILRAADTCPVHKGLEGNVEMTTELVSVPARGAEPAAAGAPAIPIRARELDHVVLRARDLERMVSFYHDVLGCPVERRQDEIGLVQMRAGRSLVDIVSCDGRLGLMGGAPPGAEGRNMDHLCLRVEPFDAAAIRAHLEAHGVVPGDVVSRYGAEGDGPSIYLADVEGNTVELKGPPER